MNSDFEFRNPFFIGIAGTGMSAIAQYLQSTGITVAGSDRYFKPEEYNETKEKLEAEGIHVFFKMVKVLQKQPTWLWYLPRWKIP